MDTGNDFGSSHDNQFQCTNCVQCGDDKENGFPCCGCVNLDLMFGYSDMPDCDHCTPDDDSDGSWPGDLSAMNSMSLLDDDEEALDRAVDLEDDEFDPHLDKRVPGIATISQKTVTVCPSGTARSRFSVAGRYSYPAFPAPANNPWDGIENGRWDSISRYWGNTSVSCSNWAVSNLDPHDTAVVGGPNGLQRVRAKYQSTYKLLLVERYGAELADTFQQRSTSSKASSSVTSSHGGLTRATSTTKTPCHLTLSPKFPALSRGGTS